MKTRIAIVSALLLGVMLGAVGTRALCDAGHCGGGSDETGQVSATQTTAIFGAGSNWSPPTSTAPADVPAETAVSDDVVASPTAEATKTIAQVTGLAVIGDSTADEYRADNPRGGEFGAVTFNWVELLAGKDRANLGAWVDSRPEPRRGGYEYNWARSGATTATMIGDGQHTGVADQIRADLVSHVVIQIGINDFYVNDVAFSIYNDQLTGEALQAFLDGMVANVKLAVGTVKAAGTGDIILAATPNYLSLGLLPEAELLLPDDAGRQRVIDAFNYVNQGLSGVAASEEVSFFDFNAALAAELDSRYDPQDGRLILVGGERIDLSAKGNEPHHLFVDDEYAHPGTVLSGLIADLYIEEMNEVFGTGIAPFSDDEILYIAGLQETALAERGPVTTQ